MLIFLRLLCPFSSYSSKIYIAKGERICYIRVVMISKGGCDELYF